MDPSGELFLSYSINKLTQMTGYIDACFGKLTSEQIWQRGGDAQNSIGNLVLHLCGNLRQWIGSSIGGQPDIRRREEEFTPQELSPNELIAKLTTTVRESIAILQNLPPERLTDTLQTQDGERKTLELIYQVVGHFQLHTGQIMFATKLFTNDDLKFYTPSKKSA